MKKWLAGFALAGTVLSMHAKAEIAPINIVGSVGFEVASVNGHMCASSVLDCIQTRSAGSADYNLSFSRLAAQIIQVDLTQFNSPLVLPEDVAFLSSDAIAAGAHRLAIRDRIRIDFVGLNAGQISLTEVLPDLGALPAGQVHLALKYFLTNADGLRPPYDVGPLAVDAYFSTAPVPEPEAYAMFLAGFGLVGALVRRRTAGTHLRGSKG